SSGTYLLNPGSGENLNATGDLDVNISPTTDAGVIIKGDPGASPTDTQDKIGQVGLTDRVLDIISGGPVTLDTVTIQNGSAPASNDIGGGIQDANNVPLTLVNSVVRANHAAQGGGGIGSIGQLTLTDSVIGGNSASDANSGRVGGGISAVQPVNMTRSTVRHNVATLSANATFDQDAGGGVSISGTDATITDSTIADNQVVAADTVDSALAGGIQVTNANLTMTGSTISGNSLTGGTTAYGAGMVFTGGNASTSTILNSTISGNSVAGAGAGRYTGGLEVDDEALLTLAQSTVTGNTSPTAPAGISSTSLAGPVTLRGDLINQGLTACNAPLTAFTANSFNADAGQSCVGPHGDTDKDNAGAFLLDPLALNGGSTQTQAIAATSSAFDAVPAASCVAADGTTPLTVDQRGAERPTGAACDAGAYERVTCGGFLPMLLGGPGNDTLNGTLFQDVIVGSAGNDTIDAKAADDALCGGSGNDTLTGGTGQDQIFGDAGNDTVLAKDGVADTIDCGPGTDTATFDHGLDTVSGCEIDTDAPPVTGGGGGTVIPPVTKRKCKKGKKLRKVHGKKKCVKKKRKK
ncbi:MAG: hypothetical protein QOD60_56, partial [Solirubrobacterales bacterium]|nr:hypothetical protein [Solirubrobacterales bacterium]